MKECYCEGCGQTFNLISVPYIMFCPKTSKMEKIMQGVKK